MKRRRMRLKRLADTATYVAQIQMLHRCPFHSCSLFSWKNNYDSDRSEREACNKTIDLKIQREKNDDRLILFVLVYLFVDLREIMSSLICHKSECSTYEDVKKAIWKQSEIEMGRWEKSIAVGKRIEPKCKTFGSGFPGLSSPGRILSNLKTTPCHQRLQIKSLYKPGNDYKRALY